MIGKGILIEFMSIRWCMCCGVWIVSVSESVLLKLLLIMLVFLMFIVFMIFSVCWI